MSYYAKPKEVYVGPGRYRLKQRYVTAGRQGKHKRFEPLPYWHSYATFTNADGSQPVIAGTYALAVLINTADPSVEGAWRRSYAQAFDKLSGKLRSDFQTNLGETIGEARSSFVLLGDRMGQLVRAISSLRKFDVRGFLHELGARRRRDRYKLTRNGRLVAVVRKDEVLRSELALKRGAKTTGAIFLEYHLFWSPTMGDIYNTMQRAHDVHPIHFNQMVEVRATHSVGKPVSHTYSYWKGGQTTSYTAVEAKYRTRIACKVVVASDLKRKFVDSGIVNPALIAWNLTPLSMFIDYWLPVSKWLDGYTTFYGLKLQKLCVTRYGTCSELYAQYFTDFPEQNSKSGGTAFHIERQILADGSLAVPNLLDRVGSGASSWARAFTLSSVLAQSFKI